MAIVAIMVTSPLMAAKEGIVEDSNAMCDLIVQLGSVFRMLRTFAFIGAGFLIAGWAWGYISKGEAKIDDLKKQGSGLLVGFILLFVIGLILEFLIGVGNGEWVCEQQLTDIF